MTIEERIALMMSLKRELLEVLEELKQLINKIALLLDDF